MYNTNISILNSISLSRRCYPFKEKTEVAYDAFGREFFTPLLFTAYVNCCYLLNLKVKLLLGLDMIYSFIKYFRYTAYQAFSI